MIRARDVDMGWPMLDVPVRFLVEDERYPDRDSRHIYEHLKYTCSRPSPFPLPAVGLIHHENRLVVTRGHKYLRIARELGRPSLRAVLSTPALEAQLIQQFPGVQLVPNEVLEREQRLLVINDYHVYFFESPLGLSEQQRFLTQIGGFFERLNVPLPADRPKRLLHWAHLVALGRGLGLQRSPGSVDQSMITPAHLAPLQTDTIQIHPALQKLELTLSRSRLLTE